MGCFELRNLDTLECPGFQKPGHESLKGFCVLSRFPARRQMTRLSHLSASSLALYTECPAAWKAVKSNQPHKCPRAAANSRGRGNEEVKSPMRFQCTCARCGVVFTAKPSDQRQYCSTACYHAASSPPVAERFWAKVQKTESCWLWTATRTQNGYGQFGLQGQMAYAHRVAWELTCGPIPEGLQIDHLCRVRNCVNPGHLEPVTSRVNTLRGKAFQATCKRGHPFDEANTRSYRGGRICRECHRASEAGRRQIARQGVK